ncbi:MAG: AAC(3) family N-acetyltransferase [Oscillospiraceae bacterium]|nr:AAC(3) family N-acetyltransferase [Oscillospiraceae bacterium]MBQ6698047.1 AAC(3) family N-acetyltransferase [Oscillospiraceae bacterium]
MQNYIKTFEDIFNSEYFTEHTLNIYRLERKQTFPAYKAAAEYTYNLLRKEGFDAEYIEFPADGKTCYQDKCMPIGWDVDKMSLEITTKIPGLQNPVIADYEREPLHAVKHSVSTPPEGLDVKIITESQMKMGADVTGALVLLDHRTMPRCEAVRMLLDLGAIGWVSDYSENPNANPDGIYWANSATEYGVWHITANEREFISFQISERNGTLLRQACSTGTVKAHIFSDARRYETVYPAVSALLPGEDKREVWVVAHTCEPLVDDDANGVVASIQILKALRELADSGKIKLRYSVRVVFASELYGMSALCEHYGGDLSGRTIGAINMDGFTSSTDKSVHNELKSREGSDLPGFAGNIILDRVDASFKENHPEYTVTKQDHGMGDDTFFNDSTIGMPTVWILHNPYGYHHNSAQDESIMDADAARINFAYAAEWVRAMAALTEEEVLEILPDAAAKANEILAAEAEKSVRPGTDARARMQYLLHREKSKIENLALWGNVDEIKPFAEKVRVPKNIPDAPEKTEKTPWFDYCESFVFSRAMRGFPHDMLCIPPEKRTMGFGGMLYNKFAEVFSKMDGKKTLRTAIEEAEWDKGILYTEAEIKRWLHYCIMFSEYGYLTMKAENPLTKEALSEALIELGIKHGDTVVVHSGISNLGYLKGGAEAMTEALQNTLGEDGAFMAPAFTFPYLMFDGDVNKGYFFRPHDTRADGALRDKTVKTGLLPKAMVKRKDSFRSGHATHEWVAIGKDAEALVAGHGLLDAPTGESSPLGKALDKNASVVFLGCSPAANTFLHYVEVMANVPYTEPACVQYIDEEGRTKIAMIEKQLFGCRNFYGGLDNDFYKEAIRRGLHIYEVPFGLSTLYRMELRELYDITMQMLSEDEFALLCKKPDCPFCKKFAK